MKIAIEMDDIGLQFLFDFEQPLPGSFEIVPGILHPLEFEIAFEEIGSGDSGELGALMTIGARPHIRDRDLDTICAERTGQFNEAGPYSTDGVGRHEYALRLARKNRERLLLFWLPAY